jgi:2-oxoglutarate ferredoxin oxidoreductase subunit beta
VTAAIIEACWQMSMRPEQLAKLSGIGCSSKTTAYFVSGGHGVVAAAGAQRRHAAFVVATGQAQLVAGQGRVGDFGFDDEAHKSRSG